MIIAVSGAGLALVGAGTGAYQVTRQPRTATGPWSLASATPEDIRLDALRHAILAPNPHNLQPWRFRLEGDDSVAILHDPQRRLPETDPFDRQLTIGFGGLIEIARMAAAARGYRIETVEFPDGVAENGLNGGVVARLSFTLDAGVAADPLFNAVPLRRSTKEPYDLARAVSSELLARLIEEDAPTARVLGTAEPARVAAVRQLVLDAGEIEGRTARTHLESVRLMRVGHAEIDASPDGIDLGGPMIEVLRLAGQIDRTSLADPASQAYKAGMEIQRETYGSIPAALWIVTPGDTRLDQLAAGRAYVRVNLRATLLGLAMHPASQSLQEFPEMRGPFSRAHQLLAPGGGRVQMLARVGYGPQVPPSPRWPLQAKLVPA
jgi:hypothetical protein